MSALALLIVVAVLAVGAAVLVAVIVLVTRALSPRRPDQSDPREILRLRYAAGEISEDEYHQRMAGLQRPW
ncbi:SHOCT domain-containing protein [Sphaerisporangium perillae]|uniref:SHOCT domain-containing protein n=1 Tax=Sphaerisporangium perillae TaxID=2935860 RepID=UPI00200FFC0A|nr:SHOCT domain-containing protein [Sphaerisporangium perillae]